jgi:hypothetical protein
MLVFKFFKYIGTDFESKEKNGSETKNYRKRMKAKKRCLNFAFFEAKRSEKAKNYLKRNKVKTAVLILLWLEAK